MELVLKFIRFMHVFKTRNTTENDKKLEFILCPFGIQKLIRNFFSIFLLILDIVGFPMHTFLEKMNMAFQNGIGVKVSLFHARF